MEDKPSTTPVPKQRDEQPPGQKGNLSYGVEPAGDDNAGGSSGSKGNQSYPVEGK